MYGFWDHHVELADSGINAEGVAALIKMFLN